MFHSIERKEKKVILTYYSKPKKLDITSTYIIVIRIRMHQVISEIYLLHIHQISADDENKHVKIFCKSYGILILVLLQMIPLC